MPQLKEAFQTAQSGTPGPVFVELPIDVLYPYQIIKKEFLASAGGRGLVAKVINIYLNNYLDNLFADAFEGENDVAPLPVEVPSANQSDVDSAVQLISQAKKPLIVLGSQSVLPPVGAEALRKAIEVRLLNLRERFQLISVLFIEPGHPRLPGWNVSWTVGQGFTDQHAPGTS